MNNNYLYADPYTGECVHLALGKRQYCNKGLAIQAYTVDSCEPYMTITVNLGTATETMIKKYGNNVAFVDTNNCPGVEEFLTSNGIAEPVYAEEGIREYGASGYCLYPAYKFN